MAQVVGSQHDLTVGGNAQGSTANTDEVCVFCHTPHGSDVAAPVPLWNKVLGAPGSYTQYGTLATPTFDSSEAPVGSVSLACLSCHDGTQAMDVVLNLPGSGGYNPAGQEVDPVALGVMVGTPVPMLGTDLTNDHPISMQYGGGGVLATDPDGAFAGTLGDPDFVAPIKATVNTNPAAATIRTTPRRRAPLRSPSCASTTPPARSAPRATLNKRRHGSVSCGPGVTSPGPFRFWSWHLSPTVP
jgi:hypothetical protein